MGLLMISILASDKLNSLKSTASAMKMFATTPFFLPFEITEMISGIGLEVLTSNIVVILSFSPMYRVFSPRNASRSGGAAMLKLFLINL